MRTSYDLEYELTWASHLKIVLFGNQLYSIYKILYCVLFTRNINKNLLIYVFPQLTNHQALTVSLSFVLKILFLHIHIADYNHKKY